ncbi:MAG: hypothetical protein QXH24_03380 [Candidatus Bathyarchaeia archaeon]
MMMQARGSSKRDLKLARKNLFQIIDICKSVELKGLDPYIIDVGDLIRVIKEYSFMWRDFEDLCLDAEALNQIASVVKMQSEWVKKRASKLYRDPFLIEEKVRSLSADKMAEIFIKVWRPIVDLEQLTIKCFREALDYWGDLRPLSERWKRISYIKSEPQTIYREEAIKEGVLTDESFVLSLERTWLELKDASSRSGKIRYWDFVGSDTFEETIKRAYITSFLITYGYAKLEVDLLENEIFISPSDKPTLPSGSEVTSFPISISFEEWRRWKEGRKAEREEHIMK